MTPPPKGRRALVTGSFQGIGLAIAQALAAEHCHLVLHGLGSAEQQAAARQAVMRRVRCLLSATAMTSAIPGKWNH